MEQERLHFRLHGHPSASGPNDVMRRHWADCTVRRAVCRRRHAGFTHGGGLAGRVADPGCRPVLSGFETTI